CGVPSLSVGTIQGGTDACSVPDFCTIDIDRRTMPGETTAGVLAEIDAVIASVQADVPDLSYSLGTPFLDVPPLDTATDGALVNALKNAIRDVTATAPQIQAFPGSTDAPNLGTHTVICGAGNLAQCHSLNEYIDIAQVEQATQIYIKTLIALQDQP
ncbi:MAG: M20 family metallopeptidase, partial [Planktomarina sp.]